MLAKLIDKIVDLAKTQTFEIGGSTYTDGHLSRVAPHVDRPEELRVHGLDSICGLIYTEREKVGATIFVQVASHDTVEILTTYAGDFSRNHLYKAVADVPGFHSGFRDRETAIIELRSLFVPGKGVEYLLGLLSTISDESKVSTSDNGVTQKVEVKSGIALNAVADINPRVKLQPFRTFLEVEQPESEFLLRVHPEEGIGLFEADGGVWKLEAKQNIAAYFAKQLEPLVKSGDVVIIR